MGVAPIGAEGLTCSGCRAKDCWQRAWCRSGWGAVERDAIAHLPHVHASLAARLGAPKHQALREALAAWTDERLRALGTTREEREQTKERIVNPRERPEMAPTFDEREARRQIKERIVNPRGGSEMAELFQKWLDDHAAGAAAEARAEALAEARAEAGRRRLVILQALRKFGTVTEEQLAELVDHPRNPRRDAPAPSAPPASCDEPRRHDQTYKLLFSQPLAARSLIGDILARDWSDELDLETLERFSTEHVDAGLRRSLSDMAWRVWFKGGKRSAVFLVEFQSSVDAGMAIRMLQYTTATAKFLQSDPGLLDAGGVMPLLAVYEVYTGPGRSKAKRSVRELCKLPDVPAAARGKIGSFPSMAYPGVDLQWMQGEGLLAEGTVAEWLGALEREPMASLSRVHASMAARLGGREDQALRDALAKWMDERMRVLGATREAREQIEERIVNLRGRPEMARTYVKWLDAHTAEAMAKAGGRAEVAAEALAKPLGEARSETGQRRLVIRQASRRFGVLTGERLAELVEPMEGAELVRVGDAVVDSGTGEELLERASNGVSSNPPN